MEQGFGTLSLLEADRRKWSSVLSDICIEQSSCSDNTVRHREAIESGDHLGLSLRSACVSKPR